jgi:hypothetical protein
MTTQAVKRQPPTPEQIKAQQNRQAEADRAAVQANLPAKTNGTAVAAPDNRNAVQKYLDEISPASIVGRMIKFNKEGKFVTSDDDTVIGEDSDFTAILDQTLIGWIKFNGEGNPPDRVMGLLYDGFTMPTRDTLGDGDVSKWEVGLDGKPQDPWQHHVYLVLQNTETQELFTYVTSSITGRRAIGNLLRHYDRMERTNSGAYPVVKLKVGGFQHRDDRVGWVKTPVLAIVGRTPKDSAAKPDTSAAGDMSDEIPF